MPAPIALFAFNRPGHLRRTLEALAANELAAESDLTIFCDGPRNKAETMKIEAVRETARAAVGFASVAVVCREKNRGLAKCITSGVTEIVNARGRVIVLEDDLVTSPYFLRYMNDGLELYKDVPQVASIHGWAFPHTVPNPPETFFLRATGSWGWGAWKRAWDAYTPDGAALLRALEEKKLLRAFDVDGQYPFAKMLEGQIAGKNDSWAVRWYAVNFLRGRLTLHPGRSLVQHIGADSSGTNCGTTDILDVELTEGPMRVSPLPVAENPIMFKAYGTHCLRLSGGALGRVFRLAKDCLPCSVSKLLCGLSEQRNSNG